MLILRILVVVMPVSRHRLISRLLYSCSITLLCVFTLCKSSSVTPSCSFDHPILVVNIQSSICDGLIIHTAVIYPFIGTKYVIVGMVGLHLYTMAASIVNLKSYFSFYCFFSFFDFCRNTYPLMTGLHIILLHNCSCLSRFNFSQFDCALMACAAMVSLFA